MKGGTGKKTFIALGLGIVLGLILLFLGGDDVYPIHIILQICTLVGNIFMRSLRMLAVPLVFASVTNSVAGIGGVGNLRRLGVKTLAYFFITGCISVSMGIFVANMIQPGASISSSEFAAASYDGETITVVDAISDIVPKNIVDAMANDSMMQIIVFCVLLGIALLFLGDRASVVLSFFSQFEQVMFKIVDMVMFIVPFGVFSLMVTTMVSCGTNVMGGIVRFILCDWITCLFTIFVVDLLMLILIAHVNPFRFFANMKEAIMVAIATCVSVATIPFSTKALVEKQGVDPEVVKFVIPLGATANMTGTAGFFGIIVVFSAQLAGVTLTPVQYGILVFQAVMMAIGCATVPSIALVLSSTLLTGFGLPVASIGLIIGVYRLMDMAHTTTNALGDWVTATCISATEGTLRKPADQTEVGMISSANTVQPPTV